MQTKKFVSLLIILAFIGGCAKSSSDITAAYVSPLTYQHFDCEQIEQERIRIVRKTRELAGKQDSEATKDAVALTVGMVIFWPALFFMIGDDKKEEISRLKGEYGALKIAEIKKKCIKTEEPTVEPEKILKKKDETLLIIDEETGSKWLIIENSKRVDHYGAVKLCKAQSGDSGEIYKVPSLRQFESLKNRYKGREAIKMFGDKTYMAIDECSYKHNVYSFNAGAYKAYTGHVVCIDEKKEEWYK